MGSSASSLMLVLDNEEYCYLYDRPSFPDVLEALLEHRHRLNGAATGLDRERAHEVALTLIGRAYKEL